MSEAGSGRSKRRASPHPPSPSSLARRYAPPPYMTAPDAGRARTTAPSAQTSPARPPAARRPHGPTTVQNARWRRQEVRGANRPPPRDPSPQEHPVHNLAQGEQLNDRHRRRKEP